MATKTTTVKGVVKTYRETEGGKDVDMRNVPITLNYNKSWGGESLTIVNGDTSIIIDVADVKSVINSK